MRCTVHSERDAVQHCSACSKDFCAECIVDVNNKSLCKACVASLAGKHHGHAHHPHYKYYKTYKEKATHNKFFLFILSALPGLGYMYLGLIKRGIFAMMAFFATCYLTGNLSWLFCFPMIAIIFASFFDGFKILGQMREGIIVPDTIDDIMDFAKKHKTIIIGAIVVVIALDLIPRVLFGFFNLAPLVLIGLGVYFLFFRKKTND